MKSVLKSYVELVFSLRYREHSHISSAVSQSLPQDDFYFNAIFHTRHLFVGEKTYPIEAHKRLRIEEKKGEESTHKSIHSLTMWSKVEKTAKEVARNANAAAKMVAENEQFQSVAGKVQKSSKNVAMKINEHFEGKDKSPKNENELESSRGNTLNSPGHSRSRNRSFRPFGKNKTTADGEGDMSEIVWEDGSVKSLAALRVFGKDTTIVVADQLKVSKKKKKNEEGEDEGEGEGEGEANTEDSETERTLPESVPIAVEEGPPGPYFSGNVQLGFVCGKFRPRQQKVPGPPLVDECRLFGGERIGQQNCGQLSYDGCSNQYCLCH